MAEGKIEVLRYHVDLETRQIGVEFRVLDEATGRYEPAPPHEGAIQILPLTDTVRDALERDVLPLLIADVLEVPEAHPAALTSALHQLRETKLEALETRRAVAADVAKAREVLSRAQQEHDEIAEKVRIAKSEQAEAERLRSVAEAATDQLIARASSRES